MYLEFGSCVTRLNRYLIVESLLATTNEPPSVAYIFSKLSGVVVGTAP